MAIDLEMQRTGTLPGGLRIQAGEFTVTEATMFIPTSFVRLYGGVGIGELTKGVVGYAASICEGPTIKFNVTGDTTTTLNYMAWGY
jgi:hypothetical protein